MYPKKLGSETGCPAAESGVGRRLRGGLCVLLSCIILNTRSEEQDLQAATSVAARIDRRATVTHGGAIRGTNPTLAPRDRPLFLSRTMSERCHVAVDWLTVAPRGVVE